MFKEVIYGQNGIDHLSARRPPPPPAAPYKAVGARSRDFRTMRCCSFLTQSTELGIARIPSVYSAFLLGVGAYAPTPFLFCCALGPSGPTRLK